MEFIVTDRERIEAGIIVRSAYVVVSIHDPELPKAKVKRQMGLPTCSRQRGCDLIG